MQERPQRRRHPPPKALLQQEAVGASAACSTVGDRESDVRPDEIWLEVRFQQAALGDELDRRPGVMEHPDVAVKL